MAQATSIEWTDATWNPVTGCDRVSPGCDNCYAERIATRFGRPFLGAVECHEDKLDVPLRWRKPRRVFVNSVSDLFHPDVPDEFIARVFAAMAVTPRHTFQILTKRPQRMARLLADESFRSLVCLVSLPAAGLQTAWSADAWPLPNVWLGVSVENQRHADLRIPHLLATPAAVRFLSVEPMLGPITFRWAKWEGVRGHGHLDGLCRLDWVIVGGESGPGSRAMHPDWARTIRDQCVEAEVPFFFKQWGQFAPAADDARWLTIVPEYAHGEYGPFERGAGMSSVGKKKAGRELDGRTWDEYPEAAVP